MSFEAMSLEFSEMNRAATAEAVRLVAAMLEEEPTLTGNQVLEHLQALETEATVAKQHLERKHVKHAECRHCHKPITAIGERWTHDRHGNVGCRAASFNDDAEEAWDESLNRSWKASPVKRLFG